MTVKVLDINEAPTLATQFLSISENVPVGTVALPSVGGLVSAGGDVDAGDVLTYVPSVWTCLSRLELIDS